MPCSTARFRRLIRPSLLTILLAGVGSLPVAAADIEPYLFAGFRDGGLGFSTGIACIAIVGQDCPVSASTEDSDEVWGLGTAVRMKGPWWLDLRWSRQNTEARFFSQLEEEIFIPGAPLEISNLHAGVEYRFLEGRWSPFVIAFGGISHLASPVETSERTDFDLDRASGGLGGGAIVDLGPRIGLRLEIRGIHTDLPGEFEGDLDQVEGAVGLRFRVGSPR
jgi:hypothetical protein